jgi:hypothetical protein
MAENDCESIDRINRWKMMHLWLAYSRSLTRLVGRLDEQKVTPINGVLFVESHQKKTREFLVTTQAVRTSQT